MKTKDARRATILFWILLLPTIFLLFYAIGGVFMLVLMIIGVVRGSAAAGGTWVLMATIVCTTLALGFVSMLRDLWRRSHVISSEQ